MDYAFLKNIEPERLKRLDLGTTFSFGEVSDLVVDISRGLIFFENRQHLVSTVELESLRDISDNLRQFHDRVLEFNQYPVESADAFKSRREELVNLIRNLKRRFNQEILPLITNIEVNSEGKFDTILKNLQEKVTSFDTTFNASVQNFNTTSESKIQEFQQRIASANSLIQETRQINEEAKNFTIDKLVEKYSEIFSIQANKNLGYARKSMFIFVLSLVLGVVLILCFFVPILKQLEPIPLNNPVAINQTQLVVASATSSEMANRNPAKTLSIEYVIVYLVSRLTILGLISIAVKESLKNYNVNMHLYTINLHRHNSLQSFDMLISNTKHYDDAKNHLIRELAQTIYANQDSGYLSSSDKKGISVAQVTELIKALKV